MSAWAFLIGTTATEQWRRQTACQLALPIENPLKSKEEFGGRKHGQKRLFE